LWRPGRRSQRAGQAAGEQAAVLTQLAAEVGLFRLFLEQQGDQDRFRLAGRLTAAPSGPWGWDDLE